MHDRIVKVKEYVKDRAPEIITATAAVTLVGLALLTRANVRSLNNARARDIRAMQLALPEMIKSGRSFTFYPEIGAFWDDLK